jgi:hypothetical protein
MLFYNDYNYVILVQLVKQKRQWQRTNVPPLRAILIAMMMCRWDSECIA